MGWDKSKEKSGKMSRRDRHLFNQYGTVKAIVSALLVYV